MARPPLPLEQRGKIRRTTHNGSPAAVAYFRDSDGKRRRMLRTGATPAAAERALEAALKERMGASSDEILTGDSRVSMLAEQWYEEKSAGNLKQGSLRTYRVSLDTHILPGIGELRLYEANVPRIDRFLKTLHRTSGPGTATTARVVLKGVFALAVRHGALKSNPVPSTATAQVKRAKPVLPSKEQVVGIRTAFHDWDQTLDKRGRPRVTVLGDAVDMLTGTGLRTGELLALKWSDIDILDCTLTVRRTIAVGEDGRAFLQEIPKTEDSQRTLHLPPPVMQMLTRRSRTSEFVFPSSTGTWWHPANFRARWREVLRGTAYEGVTPKVFRKLVATTLQRALGSRGAADQLGHASERTTETFYIEPTRQGPATSALLDLFAIKVATK